ncbi:MAG: potassium transporter TrkG [Patescibacteria group bacterium]
MSLQVTKLNLGNLLNRILAPALQIQIAPALGYFVSLIISYFYYFTSDQSLPSERPELLWIGFGLSVFSFVSGFYIAKRNQHEPYKISFKDGSIIVVLAWLIAIIISALVYYLGGFPVYGDTTSLSIGRQVVDSLYESASGYSTTGASILPDIESFPRGILAWRTMTHWLGGMGMSYLAITLIRKFVVRKGNLINAEAETPNFVEFDDEKEAFDSGISFLKIYSLLTGILFVLLLISGAYFGSYSYNNWYDNVFDAWIHSLGTLGTGGFSSYNNSVGMPEIIEGSASLGGLKNQVSEWIIAFFMMFAGINMSLWYVLAFRFRSWRDIFSNTQLKVYLALVTFLTIAVSGSLHVYGVEKNILDSLRYAFFNVNTILSTTGYTNTDFASWPALTRALLFIGYFLGGMVGSTAGGLKISRFIVLFRLSFEEIKGLLTGKYNPNSVLDGVKYDLRSSILVLVHMVFYFILFLAGGVLILATSPNVTYTNGVTASIDFSSAFTASIAVLGNIGPAIASGIAQAGPSGNYYAFSETSKIIMILFMLIGRLGVLTFATLFITNLGEQKIDDSIPEIEFEIEKPALRS